MTCCAVPCCSDNADLEAVLKETERQRREFAARYAFMTLDTDADGYVSVEQVGGLITTAWDR
jgi:Ca2+-binding EF-hand superfamily protein